MGRTLRSCTARSAEYPRATFKPDGAWHRQNGRIRSVMTAGLGCVLEANTKHRAKRLAGARRTAAQGGRRSTYTLFAAAG
jgi:hypothetical protein